MFISLNHKTKRSLKLRANTTCVWRQKQNDIDSSSVRAGSRVARLHDGTRVSYRPRLLASDAASTLQTLLIRIKAKSNKALRLMCTRLNDTCRTATEDLLSAQKLRTF